MLNRAGRRIAITLTVVGLVAAPGPVDASTEGWVADYTDDFSGPALDAGWTLRDGYALAFPSDVENHAAFDLADDHLTISIPGGQEHNMWELRHAEAMRAYEGSGVYQIKVDSDFSESQQFGLVFESGPGTFLLFMLYGHTEIHAYVERFVADGNGIAKHTTHGLPTGLNVPHPGPYYIRVAVDDAPVHTERTWTFEWSLDGANWNLATSGVMEGSEPWADVGDIQTVSLFAGNQPNEFSAFEARFDYFYATSDYVPAPLDPPTVSATSSSDRVDLTWAQVLPGDEYRIHRALAPDGPFEVVATVTEPAYTDLDVVSDTTYYYAVSTLRDGGESALSAVVVGAPHSNGLEAIPGDGLVLALLASELEHELVDGSPVGEWADAAGGSAGATGSGSSRPTFVSSGMAGEGAVRFDGVNDHLNLAPGFEDFTAGMSMYVVAQPSALQAGFKLVSLGNGGGQQNIGLGRAGTTSGLQYFTTRDDGAFGWFSSADGLTTGDTAVYSVVQEGGAENAAVPAWIARDGNVIGSGTVYVPPVTARSINYVGRSYWNEGWFQGDIAEILIYNRHLTPTEQASVASYLSGKYSLGATPTVLAPPAGVTASAGDGSVSLAWDAVAGATGYRVYRSTGGGAATLVGDVTTTTYDDTSVTNGTSYTYTVRTLNAVGESTDSATVTATPSATPTVLAPPAGVTASAGDGSVSLAWDAVAGATGYRVYRSTGGGAATLVGDVTTTTYDDTSVTNGTSYTYTVRTLNAVGESTDSAAATATPVASPIPTNGLVLGLDASTLALADGAAVSSWSGVGVAATASGSARPTLVANGIGGRPSVRFDGVDDSLNLGAGFSDFTAGMSMFVVANSSELQPGFKIVALGNGAGQQNLGLGRAGTTSGLQYFTNRSDGAYGWFDTPSGLAVNESQLITVTQPGGTVDSAVTGTATVNGTTVGSGTVYVPPVATRSTNYIGRSYWNEGWFAGDIAEVIIYNRTLTPTETATITDYLTTKYTLGA